MIDKNRAKKMLIVTLVIGICILTAGISGRVIMGRITDKVMSASFIESMNNEAPELSNIINRSMGRLTIKLFVSLIKNDSTGFINAINDVAKSIGSIADSSGIGSLLLSPFFEESARTAFQEARRQLVESTGAYMPLLQFTAYYSELLIIGGVVSSASLLLWFLVGGKKSDIWGNKAPFVIGMIWIVIIFIMTIIVLNVTGDILDTESIESSQSPQYDYSSIDTSNSYIAEDIDLEQTENEAVVSTYYNEEAAVEEVAVAEVYSGRVYVIKIDIDTGAELSTYYQTVDSSLGVIASGGVPDGYSIVGDSFQSVNVASNGTVTPNPVYFYYKKKNITPHVNTGSVYIRKIDIDTGEELSSYYETVDSSVGIVAAGLTPNGYSLACGGFCNVSVANDGTVNPSSITFYYRKDRSNSNYGSAYDIGIPNLNGKTYKKDDMNVVILWVQIQMKATGKYYQGNNWDETGNLGDHTMQEIAKFMKARGYRNHSGKVDQTVIDELASYLGNRRKPVYVGGFYEHMNSIMRGGSTGSMTKITKSSNAKSIKWVQTCLKYLKYYSGSIDGKFSSGTINAIKKFQSKNGFVQREYVTLGVARAMLEAYYNAGGNLNNLP